MNRAGVHALILAGAGAAALAATVGLDTSNQPGAPEVVSVPRGKSGSAPTPVQITTLPTDRPALARELQRELRRVGCYDGEINGVWTTSTRMAMKAFNDRVNAQLPIEAPDPVLLTLLQARKEPACGVPCPPGEAAAGDGRCLPTALIMRGEQGRLDEREPHRQSTAGPAWSLAAPAPAAQAVRSEARVQAAQEPAQGELRMGGEAAEARAAREAHSAPPLEREARTPETEPEAASAGRPKASRHHRRLGAKPPKFLRAIVRSVARSLAGLP
jgi:hypothetical protein